MGLKIFDVVSLSVLNIGNRFYIHPHKNKVYELIEIHKSGFRNPVIYKCKLDRKVIEFKQDKQVIFLR